MDVLTSFRMKQFLVLAAMLSAIAGCSIRLPAESVEKRLGYSQEIANLYHMDESWWTVYGDKQLNKLILTALLNNLDYAKSAVRIRKALYQANLLGVDLLPKPSATGEASTTQNMRARKAAVNHFSGELTVNYEFDLWRKLADSVSSKEWEYKATLKDREVTKLALISSVIDAYFNLAYIGMALKTIQQSIIYYEKILYVINIKHQYGKLSGLVPEQAAQSLLAARNNFIDFEVHQQEVLSTLRILLNFEPKDQLNIVYPDILELNVPEINLNVPLAILANRPDLKAAQYRLQSAFKNIQAEEKGWLPQITLEAALNSSSEKYNTMLDIPFASGLIKITFPFLQWNTVKWNIKISESEYDEAKIDYEKEVNSALNELSLAFIQYKKAKETFRNTILKHEHDKKICLYYKNRYDIGASEFSDWLSSLNVAIDSQLEALKNKYSMIKYENFIYKLMAGRYVQRKN